MFIFEIIGWIINGLLFIIGFPLGILVAWICYHILMGVVHLFQNIYEELSDNY